jgi:hypothetical protein
VTKIDVFLGKADYLLNATLASWPKAKAYDFSGHDATVYALEHALGVGTDQLPRYTATILFELHKDAANVYLSG